MGKKKGQGQHRTITPVPISLHNAFYVQNARSTYCPMILTNKSMNPHLISTTAKMTLKSHLSFFLSAALVALSTFGAEPQSAPQSTGLPVTLSLDKPGYVTAVIERADGRRVGNLASEVKAQAGPLTLNWDLYDVGVQKGEKEPYTRALVEPGTYTVGGLVHDGIDLRYEMSVYSPGTPPWKTEDSRGRGWETMPRRAM